MRKRTEFEISVIKKWDKRKLKKEEEKKRKNEKRKHIEIPESRKGWREAGVR